MLLLSLVTAALLEGPVSDLKPDETVIFFPTWGKPTTDGQEWELSIHGWVFEPETDSLSRNAALGLLRRVLRLEKEDAGTAIFRQRARAFLVDNERNKAIVIRCGDEVFTLAPSEANGHFQGTIRLTGDEVNLLTGLSSSSTRWLPYSAVLAQDDAREFRGAVQLIAEEGISVVSDIDDTIKVSNVADRQELLRNTFLREFEPVPGMVDLYSRLEKQGAAFHYVTASPWQLYEPLAAFVQSSGLPRGGFHMKSFRAKDRTLLDLLGPHDEAKTAAIEPLLAAFPRRRFVLVGDSGERDPEIYGSLARKHPDRLLQIWIRNVTGEPADSARFQQAFAGLPRDQWTVFERPSEIDTARLHADR